MSFRRLPGCHLGWETNGHGLSTMRAIAVFCLLSSGAWAQSGLMDQFQFESKLFPNLHHFLYTLARARNNAPDRDRAAVRHAPLDVEGFDALSAERKTAWDEAVELYRSEAASMNISFGPLVDVNYAVADLKPGAPVTGASEIPSRLREALSKAAPVYRDVWWPRHDAANQAWIRHLRPRVEEFGPKIVAQLVRAFHHDWPTARLRVEVTAYANFAGAYTTDDPPLITMASLDEEQQGDDALEELFHECSHLMMGTIDAGLENRAKAAGKPLSRMCRTPFSFILWAKRCVERCPATCRMPSVTVCGSEAGKRISSCSNATGSLTWTARALWTRRWIESWLRSSVVRQKA